MCVLCTTLFSITRTHISFCPTWTMPCAMFFEDPGHSSGCVNSIFGYCKDCHKEALVLPLTLSQFQSEPPSLRKALTFSHIAFRDGAQDVSWQLRRCSGSDQPGSLCEATEFQKTMREVPTEHSSVCCGGQGLAAEWTGLCLKAINIFYSPSLFLFHFLSRAFMGNFLLLLYREKRMGPFWCAKAMEFHIY